jgi:hypothetical protein
MFSVYTAEWFRRGGDDTRRLILKTAGLNPTLNAGKLNVDARLPFRQWKDPADMSDVCRRTALAPANKYRASSISLRQGRENVGPRPSCYNRRDEMKQEDICGSSLRR